MGSYNETKAGSNTDSAISIGTKDFSLGAKGVSNLFAFPNERLFTTEGTGQSRWSMRVADDVQDPWSWEIVPSLCLAQATVMIECQLSWM